jgi:hypothetical protein
MTIQTKLCEKSDLDAGHTHAAFELQLCYGLKLLFSSYKMVDDFVVLFEFHDDLALLLYPDGPSEIKFYQLKSYANDISLTNLVKRAKSKKTTNPAATITKDSVLEKLYFNLDKFGNLASSADIVSATHCTTSNTSDTILHKERFTFDELGVKDKEKVIDLLNARFPTSSIDDASLAKIGYTKAQMSKEQHLQIVKGAVHDFLLEVTGSDDQPLQSLTATIKEICRKKQTKKTCDVSDDYSEALKQKGVSKSELDEWIKTARNYRKCPAWQEISVDLGGLSLNEKLALRSAFEEYKTEVLNSDNAIIGKLKHSVAKQLVLYPMGDAETLIAILDRVYMHLITAQVISLNGISKSKIKAATIYEIYTKE